MRRKTRGAGLALPAAGEKYLWDCNLKKLRRRRYFFLAARKMEDANSENN